MTAGELLRQVRRRHGLTQQQLAARAHTSQAQISRIERDLVSPTVATLAGLLYLMNEELDLTPRPVDWGHDMSLNADNLRYTPEERIHHQASWSRGMRELQNAARG